MGTHITIHPEEVSIRARVKPLPLGNFHLEINAGQVRISLFGDEREAAGLDQIATIINATFGYRGHAAEMMDQPSEGASS